MFLYFAANLKFLRIEIQRHSRYFGMRFYRFGVVAIMLLWLNSGTLSAQTNDTIQSTIQLPFPQPLGLLSDFEELFDSVQKAQIVHQLTAFRQKQGYEIALVSISGYGNYSDLKSYATDLFNSWGIGEQGKNTGVLLILSKQQREVRIATGLGVELQLTNDDCNRIFQENMLPLLKAGNYYDAVSVAITEIVRELQ